MSWGASTDNVGVTGYHVERCAGAGCSNFAQVATSSGTGTAFKDTTVSASTSYSYRVRAFDAAGNQSVYSNTAVGEHPGGAGHDPAVAAGDVEPRPRFRTVRLICRGGRRLTTSG